MTDHFFAKFQTMSTAELQKRAKSKCMWNRTCAKAELLARANQST